MKDLSTVFLISLLFILMNGCHLDELDFKNNMAKDQSFSPQFVFPVAKGTMTVWDFVSAANENDSSITKDANGLIKIVYKQNDLFTYNVREMLDFPVAKTFTSGGQVLGDIAPEDIIVSRAISLNELSQQMNGMLDAILPLNGQNLPFPAISNPGMDARFTLEDISEFSTITLSKGTLKVQLKNKLQVPITINGSLFDVTNNSSVADFSFSNTAPATTKSLTFDLAGTDLSNKIQFRLNSFDTPGSSTPVNIDLNDYFEVTFTLTELGISKGYVKISKPQTLNGAKGNFEFEFPEPDLKAFGAELNKGSLTIRTVNSAPFTGTINFTIPEIKDKTTGTSINTSVAMNGTPKVIPLDNCLINFASDLEKPYNRIPYTYTVTINNSNDFISYSATDAVQLEITIDQLDFQSVTGDFGQRSIQVDPAQFDLNVDLLDKIIGNFKLDNPSMVLSVRNSMGMPATMSLGFMASNKDGNSVTLTPPAFDVPVPANIHAGVSTTNLIINKENSNLVDFISLPPTGQVSYMGKVDFNPSGAVSPQNPNFLDIDATFGIDMALELPLELQINNLEFKDTSSISGSDFENIENAELILNTKNGIPFDIDMQLFFIDTISGKQHGASKLTRMLSAASISTEGVITPVESSQPFTLNQTEMTQLKKANGIIFFGKLSSPNGGNTVAPVLSNSQLEMNVVVKSKVNIKF